jgi:hypothetical protein
MVEVAVGQYIRSSSGLRFEYEQFQTAAGGNPDFVFQNPRCLFDVHFIARSGINKLQEAMADRLCGELKKEGSAILDAIISKGFPLEQGQEWTLSVRTELSQVDIVSIVDRFKKSLHSAIVRGLNVGSRLDLLKPEPNAPCGDVYIVFERPRLEAGFHIELRLLSRAKPYTGRMARKIAHENMAASQQKIVFEASISAGADLAPYSIAEVGSENENSPIDRIRSVINTKIRQTEPGISGVIGLVTMPGRSDFTRDWDYLLPQVLNSGDSLFGYPRSGKGPSTSVNVSASSLAAMRDDTHQVSAIVGISLNSIFQVEEFKIWRNPKATLRLDRAFDACSRDLVDFEKIQRVSKTGFGLLR